MRLSLVLFLIILFLASFLRMEGVFTNSFAFTYDVGRDLLAVQEIFSTGKIPLIGQTTGFHGLFYGPWWYYVLTPIFLLSSGNPTGIAFFMALSGVLTVILGFILGKSIKDSNFGLIFASFLGVSPVMVGIATQIWNPNLAPFYIMIFFFCLNKVLVSLEKKKNLPFYYSVFLGFIIGLILDCEIVFGTLFSIGMIFSFIFLFRKIFTIKHYLLIIVGFFIVLLPRIIFELRHEFLMTKSILSFLENIIFHKSTSVSQFNFFNGIVFLEKLWNDTVAGGNFALGISLLCFSIIILSLFYKKINIKEKLFLKINLIIILSFIIGLSFFPGDIWGHYTVGLPVSYIFILSLVLYSATKISENVKKVIAFILLLIIMNFNVPQAISNIKNPYWEGDASLYRNQLGVVDYIYKYANKEKFNYIAYTPPIYDYPYQYIFSWHGKSKYGYTPSKNSEKLLFVILEPDNQYPERIKNWLEVRKNDGKVISEVVLNGDIKLQTRTRNEN